jgi:amidase
MAGSSDIGRRSFLGGALLAGAASSTAPVHLSAAAARPAFDLAEETLDSLAARMHAGRDTAVSLASKYLARIGEIDKKGPAVNAVIELNPDALRIARELDGERKRKGPRGPLHGVPVLIKDNIETADRMSTTAGSLALEDSIAARDAFIVERLRAVGAVILGKTNLSEWANYRSTHSVSGWSGRGGQTRNPYVLDRNPCGSSSGSGAAVAANLCAVAIGTETDGSVVCPASMNGVVGIKPTLGLLSRSGIIPIAHSQDTAGPMARTLRDAAILLGALAGADPRDPATRESDGHAEPDYTKFLDSNGLRGARLGVARNFMGNNQAVDRLIEDQIAEMRRQGAEIIDPADLPSSAHDMGDAESQVLAYEFKADLNAYLAGLGPNARIKTLADLIVFNNAHSIREMPWFGQELFLAAQKKGPLTDQAYLDALARSKRLARAEGIDAIMASQRLDALIAPTAGPAWLTDWVNGDEDTGGCSTPAAVAGYPHITVPAGFVYGLPIGLSFFGRAWSEGKLLRLAFAFEQLSKARREPKFLKTAVLTG